MQLLADSYSISLEFFFLPLLVAEGIYPDSLLEDCLAIFCTSLTSVFQSDSIHAERGDLTTDILTATAGNSSLVR